MNMIKTEKLINRTRYIIAAFFLITGVMAKWGGSVSTVYYSVIAASISCFLLALINQFFIFKKYVPNFLVYFSITFDAFLVFFVKYSFHFDPVNGYGLSVKEPGTFIVLFVMAIITGLRYNKFLNLYFGILSTVLYIILLLLGIRAGDLQFVQDPALIFRPESLRLGSEAAKIIFLLGNTYFLYLVGSFTTKNIQEIHDSREKAHHNLKETNTLIRNVQEIATDLASSMEEISATSQSLSNNSNSQALMENEIVSETDVTIHKIEDLAFNVDIQHNSFNTLSVRIDDLSNSILQLSNETKKCNEYNQIN